MASFDELVTILKDLYTSRFYPKPNYISGLLGDGNGRVVVPNREDYCYARYNRGSNRVFQVFNKQVNPVDGWPVLIGEFPWQPGLTQVISTDWGSYAQTGWGQSVASVDPHAPTHEWPDGSPGSDPINVYPRSIAPGRVYMASTGSTTVYANAFNFDYNATGSYWPGSPGGLALGPLISSFSSGTAAMVGIYHNPETNALGAVTGTTSVYTEAVDPPRPQFPAGVTPLAFTKIFFNMGQITEGDIRDARRFINTRNPDGIAGGDLTGTYPAPVVSGIGGYPIEGTPSDGNTLIFTGSVWGLKEETGGGAGAWPLPNKIKIGSTEYDTIAAANAAYSSGDVIIFGAGTFTLLANTTFAGAYLFAVPGGTTISGSYDFVVNNGQAFGLTFSSAVAKTTTGTTTWDRCEGDAGIDVAGTEATIRDCNFHTVGLTTAATTTRVEGGRLYDITRTAGNVYLNDPDMIVQPSVDSGTNIYGFFKYNGRSKTSTVLDDQTPIHHFRTGSAPSGFVFEVVYGFSVPTTFSYSFEGDFLQIQAGSGKQSFLVSGNITLQGKMALAAIQPANGMKAGIRMVGSGGNYFEFYVQHAGSGSQLSLYLDENGSTTGPVVTYPVAGKLGLALFALTSGSYVRPIGYVFDPATPFDRSRAVVASIAGSTTTFNVFNYGLTGYGSGAAYWDWFFLS